MTVNPAFPSPTGVALSTAAARANLAALVARDASGVVRAGVVPRHTNPLVTARASLGVDVAAFEAILNRAGALFISNDGTVTVALPAAPSSNSRIDVVHVKQDESVVPYSDADNTALLGVVSGTAAASPTAPTVPAGALALAQVLVPSTATTTQSSGVVITPVHPYTGTAGGPVLVRNAAELAAWAPAPGNLAYQIDAAMALVRVGTEWHPARPNVTGAMRIIAATQTWANQTGSLGLLTGADQTAASATFTKYGASTRLRVRVSATAQLSAGVAQVVTAGLRINGVDYDVAMRRFNQATDRQSIVGEAFLTGVSAFAAGTIQPGFRTATASNLQVFVTDDYVSWSIEEVE